MGSGLILVWILLWSMMFPLSMSAVITYEDDIGDIQQVNWPETYSYLVFYTGTPVKKILSIGALPGTYTFTIITNVLSEFPDFTNCTALSTIDIIYNDLTYIEPEKISVLTSLTRMWLHYNKLTAFPDVQGPGAAFTDLSLSANLFTEFPTLSNYTNLAYFYFGANQLDATIIDLSQLGLSPSIVGLYLDINTCQTQAIIISDPATVTDVAQIAMPNNELTEIPDFKLLAGSITTLDFNQNNIKDISNHLDRINALTNLQILQLANNGVVTMPNVCLIRPLSTFDLQSNSFHCDCRLRWLKAADMASSNPNAFIIDSCASPPNMAVGTWNDQQLEDFKCDGKPEYSLWC